MDQDDFKISAIGMKTYQLTEDQIKAIFRNHNPFLPGSELHEIARNLIDQKKDKRLTELEKLNRGFGKVF